MWMLGAVKKAPDAIWHLGKILPSFMSCHVIVWKKLAVKVSTVIQNNRYNIHKCIMYVSKIRFLDGICGGGVRDRDWHASRTPTPPSSVA